MEPPGPNSRMTMVVSAVTTADDDTARAARPMDTAVLIVVSDLLDLVFPLFLAAQKGQRQGGNQDGALDVSVSGSLTEGQVALALSPQLSINLHQ